MDEFKIITIPLAALRKILLILLGTGQLVSQDLIPPKVETELSLHTDNSSRIDYLLEECEHYRKNLSTDTAIAIGKLSLQLAGSENNYAQLSKSHNYIGLCYRDISDYPSALSHFKEGLNNAINSRDTIQIAYSYYNIGGIERTLSNYIDAAQSFLTAKDLFEKINYQNGIAHCSTNMGLIYMAQKQYGKAKKYIKTAADIRETEKDSAGYAMAVFLLAEAYYGNKELSEAKKLYHASDSLMNLSSSKYGIYRTTIFMGLAGLYYETEQYDIALDYRYKALKILNNSNKKHDLIINYNAIGKIHTALGNFKDADKYLNTALQMSRETKIDSRRMEIYYSYSKLFTKMKNYQKAFEYLTKYADLKDSLLSTDNQVELAEIENKFEKEKVEREKDALKLQLKYTELKTKSWIYFSIFAFVTLSFIFYKYKAYKSLSFQLEELNQTKDMLLSIISHDLKNPFSTVLNQTELLKNDFNSLTEEEKLELITSVNISSKNISGLLENLLQWSQAHWDKMEITREEFLLAPIVSESLELFKTSVDNKQLEVKIRIPENLSVTADKNSIRLILRNLLSNAIKFTREKGEIIIKAENDGNNVKVTVSDNGVGIEEAEISKLFSLKAKRSTEGTGGERGHGFGLILCQDLVTRNGGKLTAVSAPGKGSTFIFTLPAKDFS